MAGATQPVFASTPKAWGVIVPATLDTSLTAPSNTATLVTAGSNGSKIEWITFNLLATVTQTMYNIFLYDGATYHLLRSITQVATTVSATTNQVPVEGQQSLHYDSLVIPSGWSVRVTTTNATGQSSAKFIATGGDF